MIPEHKPILLTKVYVHNETGMAYIVSGKVDLVKFNNKWSKENLIIYKRLNSNVTFGRLESEFRNKFRET